MILENTSCTDFSNTLHQPLKTLSLFMFPGFGVWLLRHVTAVETEEEGVPSGVCSDFCAACCLIGA